MWIIYIIKENFYTFSMSNHKARMNLNGERALSSNACVHSQRNS